MMFIPCQDMEGDESEGAEEGQGEREYLKGEHSEAYRGREVQREEVWTEEARGEKV